MSDADAQLQLKKRARRRLVGAIVFAGLAAVVLPMVMDQEPRQQVQDVQIRIPGQEQSFSSKRLPLRQNAAAEAEKPEVKSPPAETATPAASAVPGKSDGKAIENGTEKVAVKPVEQAADQPAEKAAAKSAEKGAEKPAEKPAEKAVEKPAEREAAKTAKPDEAQRAAAILGGKPLPPAAASGSGQYVVLIGAFANAGNVKILETKLAELNLKTFSEPLDSPQGRKTRLRAGPFPNREAAEKALEKMKRIGVGGVVAPKQ